MYGMRGPSMSISNACASDMHNIRHAVRCITYNDTDLILSGREKNLVLYCVLGVLV